MASALKGMKSDVKAFAVEMATAFESPKAGLLEMTAQLKAFANAAKAAKAALKGMADPSAGSGKKSSKDMIDLAISAERAKSSVGALGGMFESLGANLTSFGARYRQAFAVGAGGSALQGFNTFGESVASGLAGADNAINSFRKDFNAMSKDIQINAGQTKTWADAWLNSFIETQNSAHAWRAGMDAEMRQSMQQVTHGKGIDEKHGAALDMDSLRSKQIQDEIQKMGTLHSEAIRMRQDELQNMGQLHGEAERMRQAEIQKLGLMQAEATRMRQSEIQNMGLLQIEALSTRQQELQKMGLLHGEAERMRQAEIREMGILQIKAIEMRQAELQKMGQLHGEASRMRQEEIQQLGLLQQKALELQRSEAMQPRIRAVAGVGGVGSNYNTKPGDLKSGQAPIVGVGGRGSDAKIADMVAHEQREMKALNAALAENVQRTNAKSAADAKMAQSTEKAAAASRKMHDAIGRTDKLLQTVGLVFSSMFVFDRIKQWIDGFIGGMISMAKEGAAFDMQMRSIGTTAEKLGMNTTDLNKAIELTGQYYLSTSTSVQGLAGLLRSGLSLEQAVKLMNAFEESTLGVTQATKGLNEAVLTGAEGFRDRMSRTVGKQTGLQTNFGQALRLNTKELDGLNMGIAKVGNTMTLQKESLLWFTGLMGEFRLKSGLMAQSTQTVSGQIAILDKQMKNLRLSVGLLVAPLLGSFISMLTTEIIPAVQRWIAMNPKLVQSLAMMSVIMGSVVATLLGMAIATLSVSFAGIALLQIVERLTIGFLRKGKAARAAAAAVRELAAADVLAGAAAQVTAENSLKAGAAQIAPMIMSWAGLALAIGAVVVATIGVRKSLYMIADAVAGAIVVIRGLVIVLAPVITLIKNIVSGIVGFITAVFAALFGMLRSAFPMLFKGFDELSKKLRAGIDKMMDSIGNFKGGFEALDKPWQEFGNKAEAGANKAANALQKVIDKFQDLIDTMATTVNQTFFDDNTFGRKMFNLTTLFDRKFDDVRDKLDRLKASLKGLGGAQDSATASTNRLAAANKKLADSFKDVKVASSTSSSASPYYQFGQEGRSIPSHRYNAFGLGSSPLPRPASALDKTSRELNYKIQPIPDFAGSQNAKPPVKPPRVKDDGELAFDETVASVTKGFTNFAKFMAKSLPIGGWAGAASNSFGTRNPVDPDAIAKAVKDGIAATKEAPSGAGQSLSGPSRGVLESTIKQLEALYTELGTVRTGIEDAFARHTLDVELEGMKKIETLRSDSLEVIYGAESTLIARTTAQKLDSIHEAEKLGMISARNVASLTRDLLNDATVQIARATVEQFEALEKSIKSLANSLVDEIMNALSVTAQNERSIKFGQDRAAINLQRQQMVNEINASTDGERLKQQRIVAVNRDAQAQIRLLHKQTTNILSKLWNDFVNTLEHQLLQQIADKFIATKLMPKIAGFVTGGGVGKKVNEQAAELAKGKSLEDELSKLSKAAQDLAAKLDVQEDMRNTLHNIENILAVKEGYKTRAQIGSGFVSGNPMEIAKDAVGPPTKGQIIKYPGMPGGSGEPNPDGSPEKQASKFSRTLFKLTAAVDVAALLMTSGGGELSKGMKAMVMALNIALVIEQIIHAIQMMRLKSAAAGAAGSALKKNAGGGLYTRPSVISISENYRPEVVAPTFNTQAMDYLSRSIHAADQRVLGSTRRAASGGGGTMTFEVNVPMGSGDIAHAVKTHIRETVPGIVRETIKKSTFSMGG